MEAIGVLVEAIVALVEAIVVLVEAISRGSGREGAMGDALQEVRDEDGAEGETEAGTRAWSCAARRTARTARVRVAMERRGGDAHGAEWGAIGPQTKMFERAT